MASWDPEIYERYKTYRDRPALDLLLQIPEDLEPREIWDLGCGSGEHAAVLASRHPRARVHGLDSSPDMLAAARRRSAAVDWVQGDFAQFAPDVAPDLIFTNAALQWAPEHDILFPHLTALLADDGVFACQMPVTFDSPWHVMLRDVAREPHWRSRLDDIRGVRPVSALEDYYDWLSPVCDAVDIWKTIYLHVLEGEDPVVGWMMGTGLRPYLDALPDPAEREAFLDDYRRRIGAVIRPQEDGTTLFAFPRMFIVARRRPMR